MSTKVHLVQMLFMAIVLLFQPAESGLVEAVESSMLTKELTRLTAMPTVHQMNELELMKWTIALEAESEDFNGKLAVAYVIINRAIQRNMSVSSVIKQRYQFSVWNNPEVARTRMGQIDNSTLKESYDAAVTAYYALQDDPTNGADHFLNVSLVMQQRGKLPSWTSKLNTSAIIGNHTFLKAAIAFKCGRCGV